MIKLLSCQIENLLLDHSKLIFIHLHVILVFKFMRTVINIYTWNTYVRNFKSCFHFVTMNYIETLAVL